MLFLICSIYAWKGFHIGVCLNVSYIKTYNACIMDHLASAVSQLLIKTASSLNRAWGHTAQGLSPREITGLCLNHPLCGQGQACIWEGCISFSHLLPTPLHHSLRRIKGKSKRIKLPSPRLSGALFAWSVDICTDMLTMNMGLGCRINDTPSLTPQDLEVGVRGREEKPWREKSHFPLIANHNGEKHKFSL